MWNLDLIKMIYTTMKTHTDIHIYGIKAEEIMLRKWLSRKGSKEGNEVSLRAVNNTHVQPHHGTYCFEQIHPDC